MMKKLLASAALASLTVSSISDADTALLAGVNAYDVHIFLLGLVP